jgi:effector-binding domain-containing protein
VRWLVGLLLFAGAVAAGLFGVGYYALPSTVVSAHAVEIDRPASIIYPLIANLRSFNEFSPWYDRDPKADYVFSGPREGVGQAARWQSSVQAVGSGAIRILRAEENRWVQQRLTVDGNTGQSLWTLASGRNGGTKVTWTIKAFCGDAPQAVPCRYVNFISQRAMTREYDAALARLKTLADALPALDISTLKPDFVAVAPQDFAYVEGESTQDDAAVDAALRQSLGYVSAYMKQNGLAQAGPPLAITVKREDDKYAFRTGIPFAGAAPVMQVAVKLGKTPQGLALRVSHVGPRDTMNQIYARIDAYVRAHRLVQAGGSWEVYLDDPLTTPPTAIRTDIYFPLK